MNAYFSMIQFHAFLKLLNVEFRVLFCNIRYSKRKSALLKASYVIFVLATSGLDHRLGKSQLTQSDIFNT